MARWIISSETSPGEFTPEDTFDDELALRPGDEGFIDVVNAHRLALEAEYGRCFAAALEA